ncbi:MerR family transcriptional regulator [Paenibacillus sp. JMULE4]|uniref:MerR family transcriptional regulator n=1 Tax=unclassified Paenibacillus TaxID=185978 RepID=UPI000783E88A|nr:MULTISPECIES: MerR family transcriptional regulator [Paenibacillaceae]NTZ20743.1 MerR family transcriptional regulator [Paenibacillus sp. JMULE4]
MLSIGEIARLSDVPASTLRYYENVGLIPKVSRRSGQRRYSSDILQRIRVIKTAQQAGFHVQEIFVLLEGFDSNVPPSERWRSMAQKKRLELEEKERQIKMMQQVLENGLKCFCLSWDECFVNVDLDGNGRR